MSQNTWKSYATKNERFFFLPRRTLSTHAVLCFCSWEKFIARKLVEIKVRSEKSFLFTIFWKFNWNAEMTNRNLLRKRREIET